MPDRRPSFLARLVARVLPAAVDVIRSQAEPQPRADVQITPTYSRSGGAKFPGGLTSEGRSHTLDHYWLRMAARDAVHDSQVARAIVERWPENVVGTGLRLEPEPMADLLGLAPEAADMWAQNVRQRFHLWASSKEQHRSGTMTFYQAQYLYERAGQRDNDMFVRLYYNASRPDLVNPLQWEMLDPNQVRGDALTETAWLALSDDGIVRDAQGYETAYRVWVQVKQSDGSWRPTPATIARWGEKSGRLFMIHGFTPEYAGQGRGFSRIAHALQEFEQITTFTVAQVQKAIEQSSILATVESDTDMPSSNPLEFLSSGRGAGPQGATETPGGSATLTTEQAIAGMTVSVPQVMHAQPGGLVIAGLEGKNKLKPFVNTSPVEAFDKFVDAVVAHLSAASGIPIEMVLMRFNANYSASRACLVLFYRNCEARRVEMASDFLNPVYEMWLDGEIAAGRVACPGWADPTLRRAWLGCRWMGLPMIQIDPEKAARADQLYVELGAHTLDDVAHNHNGSSGANNRAALKRQFAELPRAPWSKAAEPPPGADGDQEDESEQPGPPGTNGRAHADQEVVHE